MEILPRRHAKRKGGAKDVNLRFKKEVLVRNINFGLIIEFKVERLCKITKWMRQKC
jgi:hypothetical protein